MLYSATQALVLALALAPSLTAAIPHQLAERNRGLTKRATTSVVPASTTLRTLNAADLASISAYSSSAKATCASTTKSVVISSATKAAVTNTTSITSASVAVQGKVLQSSTLTSSSVASPSPSGSSVKVSSATAPLSSVKTNITTTSSASLSTKASSTTGTISTTINSTSSASSKVSAAPSSAVASSTKVLVTSSVSSASLLNSTAKTSTLSSVSTIASSIKASSSSVASKSANTTSILTISTVASSSKTSSTIVSSTALVSKTANVTSTLPASTASSSAKISSSIISSTALISSSVSANKTLTTSATSTTSSAAAGWTQGVYQQKVTQYSGRGGPGIAKKAGLAINSQSGSNWASWQAISGSQLGWSYDWAINPLSGFPTGSYEHVPMLWGSAAISQFQSAITNNFGNVGVKALLSFNEPNIASESNLSPADAAKYHQQVFTQDVAAKYRIGAPAVAFGGEDWFKQWLDACQGKCLFDFVPLHAYYTDYTVLESYINQFHNDIGVDVWVTEYGCMDWVNGNQVICDNSTQTTFTYGINKWMSETSWIERYSQFGAFTNAATKAFGLMNADGSPNALGRLFATTT